jgi:hypothetical protein
MSNNEQSLTDILRNQHFLRYAAILSLAMMPEWREQHPEVPSVSGTINFRLSKLNKSILSGATSIKYDFLMEWSRLFAQISEVDSKLQYTEDDLAWFIGVLDRDADIARLTFSMLFATAFTPQEWISLQKASQITGKAESTLRGLAAAGKFIGARKFGTSYAISGLALKAYGYEVEGKDKSL